MSFYAVFIPGHSDSPEKSGGDSSSDSSFVFREMNKVLETMKKFKDKSPRFKSFPNYDEAMQFCMDGGGDESISVNGDNGGGYQRPATPVPTPDELPRPFPAPTRPQLTELKKAIESKNIGKVQELIDSNPRYLINCNGDTPTILQEGYRYNALHVAARAGHLETMQAVLELFQDPTSAYVRQLYPDDREEETTTNRRLQLLDYYLNTPDKGFNDTPLHFSVKNGHIDLVKYLCSIPECQIMAVNKNGQTPKDLAKESDRMSDKMKKEILLFLDQGSTPYYIPLYRARDEANAPILGRPTAWFPQKQPKSNRKNLAGCDYQLAAYIGPVNGDVAKKIYNDWAFNSDRSPPGQTPKKSMAKSESKATNAAAVKRSDLHKGMERIGRQIASTGNHGWSEYWGFLGAFVDLRTENGLKRLEHYFAQKAVKERTNFTDALQSKMAQIEVEAAGDSCRKKLDFSDVVVDERDESSRDSTDLYFDANESGDTGGGGDSVAKSGKGKFGILDFEQLWDQEEESKDGFYTPPQELTANVIIGQEPTKLDRDVFSTLEDVEIDEAKFPQTAAWMRMIREFPDDERCRWVPLDSPRAGLKQKKLMVHASD